MRIGLKRRFTNALPEITKFQEPSAKVIVPAEANKAIPAQIRSAKARR
jgi:hypothetical protein